VTAASFPPDCGSWRFVRINHDDGRQASADAPAATALYYKLTGAELKSKDWPRAYLKYGVLITDPGQKNETLAQIWRDLPDRKLVVYTCMSCAYVSAPCTNCTGAKCSGCPGGRCVDRPDASGKSYWDANFTVRSLHDRRPICPFGGLHNKVVPVAAWIPTKESVEAMVRYYNEHTSVGHDGIYVDDFQSTFYGPWASYVEEISVAPMERCTREPLHGTISRPPNCSSKIAVDYAGHNSSLAALQAQLQAWRPYYTAKLRQMLGERALLIANVNAPALADASLSGVTVEFEHCKSDQSPHQQAGVAAGAGKAGAASRSLSDVCEQMLRGQHAMSTLGNRSSKSVILALWLTHSEVVSAAVQCAQLAKAMREHAWLCEGDDITDCTRETGAASCVRCNTTTGEVVRIKHDDDAGVTLSKNGFYLNSPS